MMMTEDERVEGLLRSTLRHAAEDAPQSPAGLPGGSWRGRGADGGTGCGCWRRRGARRRPWPS
jgi:hypothetical protein